MEITTIACPPTFTDSNVTEGAPIWLDANGMEYQVVSGLIGDEYVTSDPIQAQPDRVNVVVGMNGLYALAAMGLTVKEIEEI
jgi:hypothetical protein